ncbi:MAG: hypothetical protein HY961_10395 [Ignavibacteriae bacterium]|nr:hypothetical protein [Ignavibacteriota bacterium]
MVHKLLNVVLGIVLLAVSGCTDSPAPSNSWNEPSLTQSETPTDAGVSARARITFVKLPASAEPRIEKSVTKRISGLLGGTIDVDYSYRKLNGGQCTLHAKLIVPPLALLRDETITVALDTVNAAVKFLPEGLTFLVPSLLDYSATGLDPQSLGLLLGLYYVDDSGRTTKMPTGGISVNITAGTLGLRLGVIPHFSRYIFGRITDK